MRTISFSNIIRATNFAEALLKLNVELIICFENRDSRQHQKIEHLNYKLNFKILLV